MKAIFILVFFNTVMCLEKKKSTEYMLQNAYELLSSHHQKEGIFKREQASVTSELGIYLFTHKC